MKCWLVSVEASLQILHRQIRSLFSTSKLIFALTSFPKGVLGWIYNWLSPGVTGAKNYLPFRKEKWLEGSSCQR